MCGTSYYGELLISIGPTVTVILKKYFFQQKRTYPIKIFFLTLGVAGGGIFFHGSLPLVGLSNHVHHVLASSRLLGVLPISAGSQAPLFSPHNQPIPLSQRWPGHQQQPVRPGQMYFHEISSQKTSAMRACLIPPIRCDALTVASAVNYR